jgi:hypothetical protein
MDVPNDLDAALRALLRDERKRCYLSDEDLAFLDRLLDSIQDGSRGVFVVIHPDERMQYMLLNTNRAGAIGLLAKVLQRTAESLEGDSDR